MPFVPLAFVVALLLGMLLVVSAMRDGTAPANRPFLALLVACAAQSILIGLRWGYGVEPVRYVLPVMAAALPALVYASFGTLASGRGTRAELLPHLFPVFVVAALVAVCRPLIDVALVLIDLGYAAALLNLARRGPDALRQTRLDGSVSSHRALLVAALALAGSAAIDGVVGLDFALAHGAHAAVVVALANLAGLVGLGAVVWIAGRNRSSAESAGNRDAAPSAHTEDDREVLARIDDVMRSRALFRDANLSLDRLARKAGIPARRISGAINRLAGRNVSQYVNDHRVAEACRLMRLGTQPLVEIMFEAGFQTKSNFNREFRRVTGRSPTEWRQANPTNRARDVA